MRASAPAPAGALVAALLVACSSHVDVGFSRDGGSAAAAQPDAAEGGNTSDAGISRSVAAPPGGALALVRPR